MTKVEAVREDKKLLEKEMLERVKIFEEEYPLFEVDSVIVYRRFNNATGLSEANEVRATIKLRNLI